VRPRRLPVVLSVTLAAVTSIAGVVTAPTSASAGPPASPVVTAEPLPTWQTNGTVWALEQVGGVVYAGGNFSKVRPPGAAPGVNEVARKNLAAFDARTGALLPFSHAFTAATFTSPTPDTSCTVTWTGPSPYKYTCDTVYEIRKSPDGSRIYVGGDFTAIDGAAHSRLAAFSTANATTANPPLLPAFAPGGAAGVNGRVRSLAVTASTVYTGGLFTSAAGAGRTRLAAYNGATGALLPWAPTADRNVIAMTMAPDNSRVILGGEFNTVNGAAIHGLAAVSASTGASTRWDSRPIPTLSYVTDLVTDADTVYVGAEGTATRVFDGRLAADPYTGAVRWVDNCLGATWALALIGDVLYSGSHAHDCGSTDGGFRDQVGTRYFRFLAESARSGAPTIQHWFPTSNGGDPSLPENHTPSRLGPRTMTTDGRYLWSGGQFTTVNGRPQQGLTRFSFRPGPNATPVRPDPPAATTVNATTTRLSWTTTEDLDDANLTYNLLRNGTLIGSLPKASKPWHRDSMSFLDTKLTAGATYTYQVAAVDPTGNTGTSFTTTVKAGAAMPAYPARVLADGPSLYWRLGDAHSPGVLDLAGGGANYGVGTTIGQPSGIASQPGDKATYFNGTPSARTISAQLTPAPARFSIELSFKTTSGYAGKLVGFGNSPTDVDSTSYDRHVYFNNNGQLVFGVWRGSAQIVRTARSYRDGAWHHLVATLGADGMKLYLDGALVGTNTAVNTGLSYNGYWRLGGDALNTDWPDPRWRADLIATIDDFAVYPTALTAAQVASHYKATRP
jgi:hypothetical protein